MKCCRCGSCWMVWEHLYRPGVVACQHCGQIVEAPLLLSEILKVLTVRLAVLRDDQEADHE